MRKSFFNLVFLEHRILVMDLEKFLRDRTPDSGVSRIVLKRGQNRDFGKKEGAKKNKKN